MRRFLPFAVFLMVLSVPAWSVPAGAGEAIGVVRNSEGRTSITRGDQVVPAAPGTKLMAGDTLSTGPDGSLGVILRDNSSLSLGPGSRLAIREFLFKPAEGRIGFLARLSRGTMAYLSGLIGKLAPEKARFETPSASIGIRGTRFAVKVGEPAPE
ncbi:MAG: FecR family protein [Deltaproteobacteria bacterium]|nr:FecR family protein [Deltaproteobacteria bacterium]